MKNTITIKALDNAEMRITGKNTDTMTATINHNHHRINVTYYKRLPDYEGWEPVQITDNVLIHQWYYIDNLKAVRDELLKAFEALAA